MHFSALETRPYAPCDVLRNISTFILRKGGHDRHKQLALAVQCENVLFFEQDTDPFVSQQAGIMQAICGIPRKARDRLGDDHVNKPRFTVCDHRLKLFSSFCVCPCYTLIGVDFHQFVFRMASNIVAVMNLLVFKALQLIFLIRRHTAINSQPGFLLLDLCAVGKLLTRRDDFDFPCHGYSPFIASYSSFG